jgi:hypothetical protein
VNSAGNQPIDVSPQFRLVNLSAAIQRYNIGRKDAGQSIWLSHEFRTIGKAVTSGPVASVALTNQQSRGHPQ